MSDGDPGSPVLRLILASASQRRVALLRQIGVVPDAITPAEIDESPRKNERPRDMAQRLAIAKARSVWDRCPDAIVLAADTVVACGRRVLPKPAGEREARAFLSLLSGRRHRVYGGVAVVSPDGRTRARLVVSAVAFKRLSEPELERYIASGEWRGKAGAYAIQGRAAAFVRWLSGSYSNIVGLPLYETSALLSGAGFQPATDDGGTDGD